VVGCWHCYLSGARCRLAYGPADTTATHCLLLQEIQIAFGFTFLVPAHPGTPGQNPESHKMVIVVLVVPYLTCWAGCSKSNTPALRPLVLVVIIIKF